MHAEMLGDFTQTVHLYDSIPPVFTHVPADTLLLCHEMWDLDAWEQPWRKTTASDL